MQVIKVAADGAITVEFTAVEAVQIRDDLDGAWPQTGAASLLLTKYIDTAQPRPRPDRQRRRRNQTARPAV